MAVQYVCYTNHEQIYTNIKSNFILGKLTAYVFYKKTKLYIPSWSIVIQVHIFPGSLEDHLNKLKGIDKEVQSFRPNIDELERFNQDIQEAMIFENRHTPYTMETLRVGWEQLMTSVARATNEVENQVS